MFFELMREKLRKVPLYGMPLIGIELVAAKNSARNRKRHK